MDRRRGRIARWLGGPSTRQRRHRRAALAGIALLVLAGVLIAVGQEDEPGFREEATEICTRFGSRVQDEYALSFPDGAPRTDAAGAEYLARAFADTMDELVAELRALDLDSAVSEVVDDVAARIDEVRANPGDFVRASPLDGLAERFDQEDLPACGSEFLARPE